MDNTLPPFWEQVKHFSSFSKRLIRTAWENVDDVLATKDAIQTRRQLCRTCDKRKGKRCSVCGCFFSELTKFAFERCPDDPPKWTEYIDETENVKEIERISKLNQ